MNFHFKHRQNKGASYMKNFFKLFLKCGITGWCTEIIFTSIQSLRQRKMTLTATTSLWMFPIYGAASFLSLFYKLIKKSSLFVRGFCYMVLIFTGEYASDRFLKAKNICPWDYSRSKNNINSLIRLDYAPLWFLFGLGLEKFYFKK